jgi:hypothetical protein
VAKFISQALILLMSQCLDLGYLTHNQITKLGEQGIKDPKKKQERSHLCGNAWCQNPIHRVIESAHKTIQCSQCLPSSGNATTILHILRTFTNGATTSTTCSTLRYNKDRHIMPHILILPARATHVTPVKRNSPSYPHTSTTWRNNFLPPRRKSLLLPTSSVRMGDTNSPLCTLPGLHEHYAHANEQVVWELSEQIQKSNRATFAIGQHTSCVTFPEFIAQTNDSQLLQKAYLEPR